VVQGTAVTITSTIGPVSPTPTGSAQLSIDGDLSGGPILLSGPAAIFSLDTRTLLPGSHVVQVNYSGDSNHLASASQLTTLNILALAAGFTLSPSTAALIAAQGTASNTVTLTAIPTGGFHSTINFACTSGLPNGATCLFTPSSVVLAGSAPATSTLTIILAASGNEIRDSRNRRTSKGFPIGSSVTFAGLVLLSLPRRNRRRTSLRSVLMVLVGISTFGFITGCGVEISLSPTAGQSTAAGAYAVTVTATGGIAVQATTIKLTVQ
jgi:Bacterial Ig-like domain (group 3)